MGANDLAKLLVMSEGQFAIVGALRDHFGLALRYVFIRFSTFQPFQRPCDA
jgi:hypothetical protein